MSITKAIMRIEEIAEITITQASTTVTTNQLWMYPKIFRRHIAQNWLCN